jgi:hypothetical protein
MEQAGISALAQERASACQTVPLGQGTAVKSHEVVTGLDRLTDPEWANMAADPADVPWMQDILP